MIEPWMYDSRSETAKPLRSSHPLTVYICGITVYAPAHLGHGRIRIVFDAWRRWLKHLGQECRFVSNWTDIDDKIIHQARALDLPWNVLTENMIQAIQKEDAHLNILPADHAPRATDYIPQMIALIEQLYEKNHAYINEDGDVCFNVKSFADYGQISKQNIQELMQKSSGQKHHPCDFVLWKKAKPQEPFWASPWGAGRPGWHIECSAMVHDLLGHSIDWHGGGMDLKFPHHENECAQSESLFLGPLAKNWMHVGLMTIDGIKMSKSLGNTLDLASAVKEYGPEVLRLFYLKTHYRKPLDWNEDALKECQSRWQRYQRVLEMPHQHPWPQQSFGLWEDALAEDFNTPKALMLMDQWSKQALSDESPQEAASMLHAALNILGFSTAHTISSELKILLEERDLARKNKDYTKADQLRAQLWNAGIWVEDGAQGSRWGLR